MRHRFLPSPAWPLLAALVVAVACASPRRVALFADYLPPHQHFAATDVIYPALSEFSALLEGGWDPVTHDEEDVAQGRRVVDRVASVRFCTAVSGPHTLEIEGRPAADRPLTLALSVNGRRIDEVTMQRGWNTYAFAVPADAVHSGWNRAELALGPATDRRPAAAAIRRVRLGSPLHRPVWPDRPSAIQMTSDASGSTRLDMPADSVLDVYLELGRNPRLVGSLDATVAHIGQADLRAAVDLLDEHGTSETVFERTFAAAPAGREPFDIKLDRWSDSTVRLRLRTWGASNGIVRWQDVGIITAGDDTGAVVARLSGRPLPAPRSSRLGRPHVIVILLDTARADAFDGSRPDRPTPNVLALAAQGTQFTQAWAPSAWTGQSVPGVLAGWYPEATGSIDWGSQIPESVPTLPQLMAKAGYYTLLWSQHNTWAGNKSLRRGFEAYRQMRSSDTAKRDQLPGRADLFVEGRPTFAFVHLVAPHYPYNPPVPFRGSLTTWYESGSSADGDPEPSTDPVDTMTATWHDSEPSLDDVRYARARYDENVLYADHLVGRLVETIRQAGQYDDTLVVALSDHGEAFYEHGRFFHGAFVYQEYAQVPFVVKWPARVRGWARVVAEPVTLVDLVPTLVDGLGLPAGDVAFHGRTLLPRVFGGARLERELYASTRPDRSEIVVDTLRSGRYKVVYSDRSGRAELYDLASDPGEQLDISTREPLRTRALLQRLLAQRHRHQLALAATGGERREALDEETLRELRALGYVQ